VSAALVLLLAGVGVSAAAEPPRRVLFVGNSLTAANDLPGLVAALSRAAGRAPLEVARVVRPGFSLDDHWRDGEARRRIREAGWDVVVLQQGPSSLPESRVELVRSTRRFAGEIRKAGALPALYMVWPESRRRHAFGAVAASYREAAQAVDGLILPVGDAWQAAWRRLPEAPLYGPDGFHPSPAGSYLAALTIYASLSAASPVGLPASLAVGERSVALPEALALTLQQAAAEVVAAR
jgi:hypothetical protein